MARPMQKLFVDSANIASGSNLITTTAPSRQIFDKNFPTGDLGVYELYLRYYGNLDITSSSGGTVVTLGHIVHLRDIVVRTDKHGALIQNLDGLSLYRIETFDRGTTPDNSQIAAATTGTPTFRANLRLPFAKTRSRRPYDTLLDMSRSRMTVELQFGVFTDFVTGGTNSVADIGVNKADLAVSVLPGSLQADELPLWQPSFDVVKFPCTATQTNTKIPLPYGDRIYKRIFVSQRDSSTLLEITNVITANTALLSLELNGFNWVNSLPFYLLAGDDKGDSSLETSLAASGWAVMEFDKSGQFTDMLGAIDNTNGTVNLVVDVTTQSNGQIWVIMESLKPINAAARRVQANAA